MNNIDPETIHTEVRRRYGAIASGAADLASSAQTGACCGDNATQPGSGCCSSVASQSLALGYTDTDLAAVPEGSNLGLGCGNPVAIASLLPGQTVLDLGAGAGFDAFLAARAVGKTGRVIGVDMTPEMLGKARANARKGGYDQVEFRLGEIEALPVADSSVDVIISNCVINLCPDKRPVYREAFRVLKPGGRLAVSDVVAHQELPETIRQDLALYGGCLAGATPKAELLAILKEAGFEDIQVRPKGNSDEVIGSWDSKRGLASQVFSAEVTARKPLGKASASCCSR